MRFKKFSWKEMVFAEDLGSHAIKSHARNQVKIASETVEIDSLHYEEKELLFLEIRQCVVW